jgi:uncharacterized membrane protein
MDIPELGAVWLHTVAFVIAWGYYGVLGRIVLPGLEASLSAREAVTTLAQIEKRAMPLVLLSVVLFVVTGSYLLFIDNRYEGLGNFFANGWTTWMLVKHLVVVGLVGAGVAVEAFARRAAASADDETRRSALRWVGLSAEAATGLGAIVALLTVAAQLSS